MKQIALGSQGLHVNAIGLGCMGMSEFYGQGSEKESLNVLAKAREAACTFWDTADMYGPFTNERLLSKALQTGRDQITLATKFGIHRNDDGDWLGVRGDAAYVRQSCEASLKRLNTDYIDLYYQHRVDPAVPIEETVGAMADLVKEGKIRYIGLSEADPSTIERAHAVHPISALQTEYSLWSREVEQAILPCLRTLDIGFVAYSPLGRGFLTGAIQSRNDLETGDWRLENPRFTRDAFTRNAELVSFIEQLAQRKACTPAQLALAWLLQQGDDIAIIPGTKRLYRLQENVDTSGVSLSHDELQALSEFSAKFTVTGSRY